MIQDIIYIAKEAGEIIRNAHGTRFTIEIKSNNLKNLVTEIDKKSERTIIDFIKKKYPSHNILAEEGGETKSSSDYLWVIDPLDGTTNFAHGLPIFSVSIGLQYKNETVAGVVYDVMRDVIYSAEKGSGSFENGKKIFVNSNENIEESLLVTGFPYNVAENPEKVFERFIEMFWEVHLNPWDICAGKLIVEEAGGKVTDFNGNPISIFNKTILSTNGKIHTKMIELLNKV